jgi:hypothetical protein
MNKRGTRVNRAQLRENERCLKDFQKGKLAAESITFDECTTKDRKFKVEATEEKTENQELKKCVPLDVPPPFAYTDSDRVNKAAMDGALALTYKIFGGPPVLDADLQTPTNPSELEGARCQLEMLKRGGDLEKTTLKQVIKAKKKALKDETVNSAAALEEKLQAVFSSNDKVSKVEDNLAKSVDKKCDGLDGTLDTIFAGSCGDPDLIDVEDCVIAAARCQACLKINAFDDLNLDCDEADDQNANGSCP